MILEVGTTSLTHILRLILQNLRLKFRGHILLEFFAHMVEKIIRKLILCTIEVYIFKFLEHAFSNTPSVPLKPSQLS